MAGTNVKLRMRAFTDYRRSEIVQKVVDGEAQKLAKKANNMAQFKYRPVVYTAVQVRDSRKGSIALVTSRGNLYACLDNAKHDTLRRALSSGGAA
ncbi:hypothetical protein EJ419_07320 [Alloscardovia theropitheci]|uniref:HK97 gp10 family phage protein n=1 Tax=Alloscardovia theropitheci TaxID=2496842 RepID=A0A4R0QQZ6_9BIFI|nr:hypothetical protein [Alloscardovia theropitheci]TCD53768.1 hypothetical protein EJ419_07320 [Alloscardovia theropitheci]